ncbi:MAG: cell division topological specificity factor MinE [Eubacterium sp.]|nr:cell division topological specificity factor MinE [Eubacterium sp.]
MSFIDFFKRKNSGDVAKGRIKLAIQSDRTGCSPEIMEKIKNDIIDVISKYMEIDSDGLDIQITQTESEAESGGKSPALYASIPIKKVKG